MPLLKSQKSYFNPPSDFCGANRPALLGLIVVGQPGHESFLRDQARVTALAN